MKRKYDGREYRNPRKRQKVKYFTGLFYDFLLPSPTSISLLQRSKNETNGNIISYDQYVSQIAPSNSPNNLDSTIDIEIQRGKYVLELRDWYVKLLKEKMLGMRSPKESFNRWLMERNLHQDAMNDSSLDFLLPSKGSEMIGSSTLMEREIMEDVPVKVNMFPKSFRDVQNSVIGYCKSCEEYIAKDKEFGEGMSIEDIKFIEKQIQEIRNHINNTSLTSNERVIVQNTLQKFKDMKGQVHKIMSKKVEKIVGAICVEIQTKSVEKVLQLKKMIELSKEKGIIEKTIVSKASIIRNSNGTIELSRNGVKFILNAFHYTKLKLLFRHPMGGKVFLEYLFLLCCRYNYFFGNSHKFEGSGHQGAVPPRVMSVLNKNFGVNMEMFASPFNCYFKNYCSAFLDTDYYFGSAGNFFNFDCIEGSFEANPPFVEELMIRMADRLEQLIERSEKLQKCLSFFLVLPNWEDAQSVIKLRNSKFLRETGILKEYEHSYVTGFQHKQDLRRGSVYKAVHETRFFFLQSEKGFEKWKPSKEVVDDIIFKFN